MGRPRVEHALSATGVEMKHCGTCDRWRELGEFNRESHRWDKLCTKCRRCSVKCHNKWKTENPDRQSAYSRKYRSNNLDKVTATKRAYRATDHGKAVEREHEQSRYYADVEAARARTAQWRLENPDKVEAQRERMRGRYARDPERYREARTAWRERNRDRDRDTLAAWRERNRDSVSQASIRMANRRRALKRELPHEPWTEPQLVSRDGPECWMCSKPIGATLPNGRRDWHVDHLIPLAKEYPDHPGDTLVNLAVACAPCNQWKNAKFLPDAIARYEQNVRLAAS